MARPSTFEQLDLFGRSVSRGERPQDRPWTADIDALARQLDPHLHLGTSSWTFPGWAGLCYPRDVTETRLLRDGLELYSRFPLFGTVGIDSSYDGPLKREKLAEYAGQLPAGFRCVEKVWDDLVVPVFPPHARYGARAGKPNPGFLDAETFFEQVHRPHVGVFEDHLACHVLEFPPMNPCPRPSVFVSRLARFLDQAPYGPRYAIELRNRELLTDEYLAMLRGKNVSHVYNCWTHMPTPGAQLDLGAPPGDILVARLIVRPGTAYDDRREAFAPYDKLHDPSEELRADILRLARIAIEQQKDLYVIIDNKAEGSAPLSVVEIARLLAKERA